MCNFLFPPASVSSSISRGSGLTPWPLPSMSSSYWWNKLMRSRTAALWIRGTQAAASRRHSLVMSPATACRIRSFCKIIHLISHISRNEQKQKHMFCFIICRTSTRVHNKHESIKLFKLVHFQLTPSLVKIFANSCSILNM